MTPSSSGPDRIAPARLAGALLLIVLVLASYYVFHKPLPPESIAPVVGVALDLLAAGLVLMAGAALGRALGDRLGGALRPDEHALIGRGGWFCITTLLGLALLSVIALGLGLAGLFRSVVFWMLLAGLMIGFRRSARMAWSDLRQLLASLRPESRYAWFLLTIVALQLGLAVLVTLTPPHGWDALVYHLVEPQRALASGRVSGYADNFYLGLPKLAETLFGVAMGLFGRDTAAAPLQFGVGLLGLLIVMHLVRRWTNRAESAWLAAALLVGGFNTWLAFGDANVDLFMLAYGAGAFLCGLAWEADRRPGWMAAAGLLAGCAIGVKYTAAPVALALALLVLARARRHALRPLLVLVGGAALAYLPWALRGLLLYGNPIYPYLFDGLAWDSTRTAAASQSGRGLLSLGRGWHLPILPFAATIFGGDFEGTYFYTAGPWLLTAPFLLPFLWPWAQPAHRRAALNSALLLAPLFLFWAAAAAVTAVGMQTRLNLTLFPLMAALGALAVYLLDQMPAKPVRLGFIFKALIALTLVLGAVEAAREFVALRPLEPLIGLTPPDVYRRDRLGPMGEALEQLDALPDGSSVRFLFEPRGYPCRSGITCEGDVLFDFWSAARRGGLPADEIFAAWSDGGHTHVLLFNEGYRLWTELGLTYAPDFDAELLSALLGLGAPIWESSDGLYSLYQLER